MDDLEIVEAKIQRVSKEIAGRVDLRLLERLCSIPGGHDYRLDPAGRTRHGHEGIREPEACRELGRALSGNHESGGKRLSNRARKGNRRLRRALCQAAWGVTRKTSVTYGPLPAPDC
jgi:hypothetical protein